MPHVLLVMRQRGNLNVLSTALSAEGYAVTRAAGPTELEAALRHPAPMDAALLDVTGYRDEAWSMCETLHKAHVPFLVISEPHRRAFGTRGLAYGAASILEKPLAKHSLLKLLESLTRP